MHLDNTNKQKFYYLFDEVSFDITERDNDIDSEDSYYTNNALPTEELIHQKIEKAIKRIFVIKLEIDEPEVMIKKEHTKTLFFSEYISRKRGRVSKIINTTNSSKKKIHSADDWDNNIRKIQVHFLNFIIYYLNDIIYSYLKRKDLFFLKFSYSDKKDINYDYVEKLKTYNIKQLLENLRVSTKYKKKKFQKDENINGNKLINLSKYNWFRQAIQTKFLELFKIYYNKKEPLKEIYFKGKKIILSKSTKNFYALLQKYKIYEKKLIEAAEAVYLNN